MPRWITHFTAFTVLGLLLAPLAASADDEQVNVYSSRHDALIAPLLDRFTEETGIEVGLITGNPDAMIKRLQVEGRNTPADILITVDAARLKRAEQAGLFGPTESDKLEQAVPSHLQDPENLWFGLSMRARVIAYSEERVDPSELSTYWALADDRWDDRVCIRSSDNVYNQSLLAAIIADKGEQAAEQWARGIVDNMARPPQGGDTDQIQAIAAGICDVAVVNTYYYGRMVDAGNEVTDEVKLFFPNQGEDQRGAHVNVTGAGVLEHAPNRDNAVRLLEFLTTPESQRWLSRVNYEYPVREGVEVSDTVQQIGPYPFKQDQVSLGRIGDLNATAVKIFDRVGWR